MTVRVASVLYEFNLREMVSVCLQVCSVVRMME